MEFWNNGLKEKPDLAAQHLQSLVVVPNIPLFHHSIIPALVPMLKTPSGVHQSRPLGAGSLL
jgi:hypothetical protein